MRTLSSLARAALSGGQVTARWIARFSLPGGVFGASDAPASFDWDNGSGPVTYDGLDAAAKVTLPALQTSLRTDSALLEVSATDPALLTGLLDAGYRAAPTDIALLLFDPATGLPAEEWLKFRGKCDQPTIADQPFRAPTADAKIEEASLSTLSMTVAPQTVDMKRGRGRYATDTDQRVFRDAGDGFFKDVALVGVSQMNWGQAGPSAPAASALNHAPAGAPSGLAALVASLPSIPRFL